jgi:hypothetical protein
VFSKSTGDIRALEKQVCLSRYSKLLAAPLNKPQINTIQDCERFKPVVLWPLPALLFRLV